jgi:hypothetical protein
VVVNCAEDQVRIGIAPTPEVATTIAGGQS